ncbi:LPS export ABC transporter periplasmic protein LptC [Hyphomicrobium sp.]|uniref:LPS export ABC transporter periplasmic protein LptC n=1 Tax=Hyphomicrobium sp. TaxID=82 RepID=UPI0025B8F19C|nr:LPS export ABC transporter periplasmic protein LptC [Hyphomicrobium sp.]MCC7254214.1 LPS export ABC transporter periplasmic protein LptC [Hyphomicrobium sp.]
MVVTADPRPHAFPGRRAGDGVVTTIDRTREFRRAGRRTALVRLLRVLFPVGALALLGVYGLSIAEKAGIVGKETLPHIAIRKILPEDLSMKNPRYEGFSKDGGSYVFTAKTARQDLTKPDVVKLDGIVGEVYQADKTRTDITAKSGVFYNAKGTLELYQQINVDSESGLKARLTRATIQTKEDLLTSNEPVLVEFPNGSVRSKQMTLRQKAREATFVDEVAVVLTPPADEKPKSPAPDTAQAQGESSALFTPSNGPIQIDAHRLDINDTGKTALFTGNVRAEQAGSRLTTPELEVLYEGEGMMGGSAPKPAAQDGTASAAGKVKRIVAKKPVVMQRENGDVVTSENADFDAAAETAVLTGGVVMTSGTDRRAVGERVEIDEASGTILLVGDVVVTQGGNELRGGRLAVDRTQGTARMTTPPGAAEGPGRIKARMIRSLDSKGGAKRSKEPSAEQDAGGLGSFKTNPEAPVDVVADSLDVDDNRKVAVFRGDVDAAQDTFRIRCAELSAFYTGESGLLDATASGAAPKAQSKGAELTRIEARKKVEVTSKDGQTATGDWADYDAKTNKITMGGNVVLSRGKSMVRGTRLLIDTASGEAKIDTAPQNTSSQPSGGGWVTNAPAQPTGDKQGRASAVFFPQELQQDEQPAAKNKKAATPPPAGVDGWSATSEPGARP